jgi:hypothetical protein
MTGASVSQKDRARMVSHLLYNIDTISTTIDWAVARETGLLLHTPDA